MRGARRTVARLPFALVVALWAFGLAGCATWPKPTLSVHVDDSSPVGTCADFFAQLDQWTVMDEAVDSGTARIESYPYLRANRFIASFQEDVEDDSAFLTWIDRMQQLDQRARQSEIANLSAEAVAKLSHTDDRQDLYRLVAHCGNLLKTIDFEENSDRQNLRNRVVVPDEYLSSRRVVGLYPITRLFVSRGVQKWHRKVRKNFSTLSPTNWQTVRYLPVGEREPLAAATVVQRAKRDALGIPVYSGSDHEILFQTHAPVWEVQCHSEDDRIGRPHWILRGEVRVDLAHPETFAHLNFTRFGNAMLTQLNYVVWFPSRPKRNAMDPYGGLLDGLTYRVTLDVSGEPVLYETVHNCGCYYKAYPTDRLQRRESIDYAEEPLILEAPQRGGASTRVVVAMESGSHFVRHVYLNDKTSEPGDTFYTLTDYAVLKSLLQPNGERQSLFNRYGLVAGTERLERFFLWPTGVHSPGAMRQWGRHAVAFVGKRHFDDPFHLEKMFVSGRNTPRYRSRCQPDAYFPQQTSPVENSQAAQAGEPSRGSERRSSTR